jgi:hypothetical protein
MLTTRTNEGQRSVALPCVKLILYLIIAESKVSHRVLIESVVYFHIQVKVAELTYLKSDWYT